MIRSAGELAAAIREAAARAPHERARFRIAEGLGPVSLRGLPFAGRGRVEIEGGSLAGLDFRDSGPLLLLGVAFRGPAAGRWPVRLFYSADAPLALEGCRFEGGEAEAAGAIVDRASRARLRGCVFRGGFNGAVFRSVPSVDLLGCDARGFVNDAFAIRNADPALAARIRLAMRECLIAAPLDLAPGDPRAALHSDALQIGPDVPVTAEISGNVVWTPGRSLQGVLAQGEMSGVIAGNAMLIRSANGVYAGAARALALSGNVVAVEASAPPPPGRAGARIVVRSGRAWARGNAAGAINGAEDAGDNRILAPGAHAGRLRGPWRAGAWGDVLAAPPAPDAPAEAVKAAIRRALAPL